MTSPKGNNKSDCNQDPLLALDSQTIFLPTQRPTPSRVKRRSSVNTPLHDPRVRSSANTPLHDTRVSSAITGVRSSVITPLPLGVRSSAIIRLHDPMVASRIGREPCPDSSTSPVRKVGRKKRLTLPQEEVEKVSLQPCVYLCGVCPLSGREGVASVSPTLVTLYSHPMPSSPWQVVATFPLTLPLPSHTVLRVTENMVEVRAFRPQDRTVREVSLGVMMEEGVTSTSTLLVLTEEELEVEKVLACKLDNGRVALFHCLQGGRVSRGEVVEWREDQEVIRHLATLQGMVVQVLRVGGQHNLIAAIQVRVANVLYL